MLDMDDIITPTSKWLKENKKIALATVISTWGSSPRPIGGQMAIDEAGNFLGSVSGFVYLLRHVVRNLTGVPQD